MLKRITFVVLVAATSIDVAADESIIAPGAKPELLQEQGAGEGPAWHPELGLLTSGSGHIWRRDRDGKASIYRENAGTNGLLFDKDGRLVMCQPSRRRVSRLEKDGS
ncbi:MAG TPA: SMP-30/gluconolactonase/LRE family protein, partial [Pirellulaceae bacterium]|nr:SMP-30/gluconolactonase/LRE family protein [Pirellulaceae bacterium]